jgi:methyl-accepting chemotaxis protein
MGTPDAPSGIARDVLVVLERVLTHAAIGAARTAVRLGGMTRRHEAIEASARSVEQVIAQIRAGLEAAAPAASKTAEAADRVAAITREGRALSAQSMTSMRSLLKHGETTNKRLQQLLVKIQEVTGVSRLIDEIAVQTKFLALNASIEASRAGVAGRTFAVVAGEIRELASSTAEKTRTIEELIQAIVADLEPARAAMEHSRALGAETATSVEAVDVRLAQVNELAEQTSRYVSDIARVIEDENQAVGTLGDATRDVVVSLGELREEARHIAEAAFAVSAVTDEGHHQLARVDIDTMFHHGLALCRALADETARILERAVADRRCTLDAVLALEYHEIKGATITTLAHLFDTSRVPASGFTPPKYHTAYDALVDRDLQVACDAIAAREPRLLFALPIDLNSYAPIHNRRYMQGWTGNPDQDLAGNRIKRFFTDNSVLVRGARAGLGAKAAALPHLATRGDFERAGADLTASPAARELFMTQTYARDTGALVTVITVPVFVRDRRWGAALVGWSETG